MVCCVYAIRNLVNKRVYIGSTIDHEGRWYQHRWYLKRKTHTNRHLQRAWNKYGEDNFVFEILRPVLKGKLLETEQRYLNEHKKNSYNLASDVTRRRGEVFRKYWAKHAKTITHEGVTDTILGWSERTGIAKDNIKHRLYVGHPPEVILSTKHLKPGPIDLKALSKTMKAKWDEKEYVDKTVAAMRRARK